MRDADVILLHPYGHCQRCLKPLDEDYHADPDDRRYCPSCCPDEECREERSGA